MVSNPRVNIDVPISFRWYNFFVHLDDIFIVLSFSMVFHSEYTHQQCLVQVYGQYNKLKFLWPKWNVYSLLITRALQIKDCGLRNQNFWVSFIIFRHWLFLKVFITVLEHHKSKLTNSSGLWFEVFDNICWN